MPAANADALIGLSTISEERMESRLAEAGEKPLDS
jgi:hypothetical protein